MSARCRNVAITSGFTLVEVAMVVLFAAVLSVGFASVATGRVEGARIEAARAQLVEARLALLGFVQSRGRLPCPANPTLDDSNPLAGRERPLKGGDCEGGYGGVLPWATLGVPALDPWGRRIGYRVVEEFANAVDECSGEAAPERSICIRPVAVDPWPAHGNALEVRRRNAPGPLGSATASIASSLAVVLVIHGRDGSGATDANGRRSAAIAGSDAARNASTATVSFVTRDETPPRGACADDTPGGTSCGFDDVVTWVSRAEVLHALARAGRLH